MAILKSENKNTDFFMILAWSCRFEWSLVNTIKYIGLGFKPPRRWL